MLKSRLIEKESKRAGDEIVQNLKDNSNEYQTADELYEIMAIESHSLEGDGDKALTTRDLVYKLLYKNIDVDSKLISNSVEQSNKSSNQYVETIIYKDPGSEGSDISDNISNEDFNDIFTINKERIDLLNNLEDTVCHKFGNIRMQTSNLNTEYNSHFQFNQSFNNEQFKNFRSISNSKRSDSTVLPASLLDYICSKRLEDNYNFYMDNIITYVKHIIEQLKRISNGDYLTEKAKERWREIKKRGNVQTPKCTANSNTVLVNSVSIPLHIEKKPSKHKSTWDNIIHSEVDVRTLSKILEKKIIVEVPKILCGTYRLFSTCHKDNLIITCKKDKRTGSPEVKEEQSRVDVILKLRHSKSGHVLSAIDSIKVLKSLPSLKTLTVTAPCSNDVLALEFKQGIPIDQKDKITELDETYEGNSQMDKINGRDLPVDSKTEDETFSTANYDFLFHGNENNHCFSNQAETNSSLIVPDDLYRKIHRLNLQSPVLEESENIMKKRKSPKRVRIKSPYENKSHAIEDRKRKKLLDIRERREKKKNAMIENCKITKHKYGRGAITVQSSNSVTKLSITNKSFYNSIYGQTANINSKNSQKYHNDDAKDGIPERDLDDNEENRCKASDLPTPERDSQIYIKRSYYLDDEDTKVTYLQWKRDEYCDDTKNTTPPISALSTNENEVNLNMLSSSTTDFSLTDTSSSLYRNALCNDGYVNINKIDAEKLAFMSTRRSEVIAPTNTPKKMDSDEDENQKMKPSLECRRSIDKIYDLIRKKDVIDSFDEKFSKNKVSNHTDKLDVAAEPASTVQASDSGTSVKHQLTSSNPSCFSFNKINTGVKIVPDSRKKREQQSITPKVTINLKLQSNKINNKTNIKENKRLSPNKIQENPLKAISLLLHEFDNVQRARHKSGSELKRNKISERLTIEDESSSRPIFSKRTPKQELHLRDSVVVSSRLAVLKEKRRPANVPLRTVHQPFYVEENITDKKISDIIDEAKELRGEAVRGPTKKMSRLNSLAQPKKTYVQAHREEFQNRFGKRLAADGQQKLPTTRIPIPERNMGYISLRNKQRKGSEVLPISTKQPHTAGPSSEKNSRTRRSCNSSPTRDINGKRSLMPVNEFADNNVNDSKKNVKIEAVETYVDSHYGRVSQAMDYHDSTKAHKSRVPLIPADIDLASMASSPSTEESTALGTKLHYMIDSMINTNVPVLSALTECNESFTSKLDKDGGNFEEKSSELDEILSVPEYPVDDIFEDENIVTAVSAISKHSKGREVPKCEIKQAHSSNELQNFENALCSQLSSGTFQKRLRIKNLTLTPKQSIGKIFILPSGDGSSLALKSTLSQNIEANTKTLTKHKILPVLSKDCVDFGFTSFPMQITTVGYAFPQLLINSDSMTKIRSLDDENSELLVSIKNPKLNKSIKLIKDIGNPQELTEHLETGVENVNNCKGCAVKERNNETIKIETTDISYTEIKNENSNNNNSTSLDMLVRLLNEIKNITSCEPHLTKQENASNLENKDLEIILSKAILQESSVDYSVNSEISLSFDNLQQLEEGVNNYSLCLSPKREDFKNNSKPNKNVTTRTCLSYQALNIDKEISDKIFQREYVHRFTEMPSRFLPISVSTSVTESLIKLINKSSNQSIYYFTDSQSLNSSISNAIKQLPFANSEKSNHPMAQNSPPIFEPQYLQGSKTYVGNLKRRDMERYNYAIVEFDPVMKMKRDVLVTVYSILVFIVFVAMSLPEIYYI